MVHLHANNQLLQYTKTINSQIPQSYAGNAYRVFTIELMRGEVLRLCSLWDKPGEHRNSLPTIARLVDCQHVRDMIQKRAVDNRLRGRSISADHDDPELIEWQRQMSDASAREDASERLAALGDGIRQVEVGLKSDLLAALVDFRDTTLAHSLEPNARKAPDLKARYGDETKLLSLTQAALDALNLGIRGSSFMWEDTYAYATRNARALWRGVTFKVLE
ncbi:hypothetical protein [Pelagibacterium halotolerans]|uniref:AbiU2 domain-containing protein n=1 Tax=Pelagibacterium halotolerans TaxID=531813 RepID=UPI00384B89EB